MCLYHFECAVTMTAFIIVATWASPSPSLTIDTTRIYLPDELEELRRAQAYQNCLNDHTCDPEELLGVPELPCSITPSVEGEGIGGVTLRLVNNPGETTVVTCDPLKGEILWPTTGECVLLLSQGPCPEGHWVKIHIPELQPACEQRPCRQGQALMEEEQKCMDMDVKGVCPPTQNLIINEFGKGECDCALGTAYHPQTQACYTPYSQGPCPNGQVIKVLDGSDGTGKGECQPNLCPEDGMVFINYQCQVIDNPDLIMEGHCYFLEAKGPCFSGVLAIDRLLLTPTCLLQTQTHSIFNFPVRRLCPRGSIRDSRGRCRKDFSKTFGKRPPFIPSRPRPINGTQCPEGEILLGGRCYRMIRGPSGSNSRTTEPSS